MLTEAIVSGLGTENRLASVIIESCSIRFNKTKEMGQLYPLLTKILRNEMQVNIFAEVIYGGSILLSYSSLNSCFQK